MVTPARLGVFSAVSFLSAAFLTGIAAPTTFASNSLDNQSNQVPVTIVPRCSSNNTKLSYWEVYNQNSTPVSISWNNFENGLTGSYVAPQGVTKMTTGYVKSDPNNTTSFTYQGVTTQTNAQVAPCNDEEIIPPVVCIDGKNQQNLVVSLSSDLSTTTVKTVDGKPLCDDVTIYFSSYVMPHSYDGKGFENNPTAYPQSIFSSEKATLKAGTDGTTVLHLQLPSKCENVQVDIYYGPEITTVGQNGHGTQNIVGQIMNADPSYCPTQPGNGGQTPTNPVAPTTPTETGSLPTQGNGAITGTVQTKETEVLPDELPQTGPTNASNYGLIGIVLAFVTYVALYAFIPRKQS